MLVVAAHSLSLSSHLRIRILPSLYLSLLPHILAAIPTKPSPQTTPPYPRLLLLLCVQVRLRFVFCVLSVSGFRLFYCHLAGSLFFFFALSLVSIESLRSSSSEESGTLLLRGRFWRPEWIRIRESGLIVSVAYDVTHRGGVGYAGCTEGLLVRVEMLHHG
jgi:hypothetical protein